MRAPSISAQTGIFSLLTATLSPIHGRSNSLRPYGVPPSSTMTTTTTTEQTTLSIKLRVPIFLRTPLGVRHSVRFGASGTHAKCSQQINDEDEDGDGDQDDTARRTARYRHVVWWMTIDGKMRKVRVGAGPHWIQQRQRQPRCSFDRNYKKKE